MEYHLYEMPRFKENITPLLKEGGIQITGVANTGFAKLGGSPPISEKPLKRLPASW